MAEVIVGIEIPDTHLVLGATALVREVENDLLYHHSRRVFLVGALVTDGVETDVLGFGYRDLDAQLIIEVTDAHPRPNFKTRILEAFYEGNVQRPQTTFGNVNADVLDRFDPQFEPANRVDIIETSAWPE